MKAMIQKTCGVSAHEKDERFILTLPTLDHVELTEEEYTFWNLIGNGKSVKKLNSEIKSIFPDMGNEEIDVMIKKLNESFLIHPVPISKGEKAFPFEERLFDMHKKDKLMPLRKNVITKDETLQYLYFLPTEETFTFESLCSGLDELLPHVSRSPILIFFDAERYLDAHSFRELVKFIVSRMPYDRPVLIFEVSPKAIEENAVLDSLKFLEAPKYKCIDKATLIARVYGEKAISFGRYRCPTDDDCLMLLLKLTTPHDIKAIEYLKPYYPKVRHGLSFKVSRKEQVKELEEFLEKTFLPIFLRFEECTLSPYFIFPFLNVSKIIPIDDDLFRMKEAFLKNYLPLSHCGAGRRKLLLAADGRVYPCPAAVDEGYSLGHIEEGINNVLKGEITIALQHRISETFYECVHTCCLAYFCGGCILRRRCNPKLTILEQAIKERIG